MVHGRMIRPPVAGTVPVKVDESVDQGHPGRQGGLGQGLPRRRRRQGMGRDQGRARSSRSSGRNVAPPFPDQNALYDHIRKAPVRKTADRQAERQRRRGVPDRGARHRGRIRMAVPVARLHGTGLRAWSTSRTARSTCWTGSQKSHFVQNGLSPHARRAARQGASASGCRAPAAYGRNDADDCCDGLRGAREGGRQAGAAAIHARPKAPAGTRRARPRSTGPRGDRRAGQRRRLRVHEQGILAHRRATPTAAGCTTRWPATRSASN